MYVVKIINSSQDCWIAHGNDGDPPRTLVLRYAQVFINKQEALKRIEEVKKLHPLRRMQYRIEERNNF